MGFSTFANYNKLGGSQVRPSWQASMTAESFVQFLKGADPTSLKYVQQQFNSVIKQPLGGGQVRPSWRASVSAESFVHFLKAADPTS